MKLQTTTMFVICQPNLYCDYMQTKVYFILTCHLEIQFDSIHSFITTTFVFDNLLVKSIVIFVDVRGAQKGNKPTPPALGKRAFENTTEPMMPKMESSCLSEVDIRLSQINILFSEINQIISVSQVPVNQSKMLLPRVNFILSEIKLFVAAQSPDYSSNDDGRSTEGFDDDDQFHYDECSDLEWDNNYQDYYHLYYDYDEDGRDDEEKAPTCREECVIDDPTCPLEDSQRAGN